MNKLAFALLLGGTAMLCALAVPSDLLKTTKPHAFKRFRTILGDPLGRWFGESPLDRAELDPELMGPAAPVYPPVTKAEALSLILSAAAKYRVPAEFVTSIVAAESNFDSTAVSDKGAIGLMQLMPDTAKEYGADPSVPAENIDAGTRYLRWLMARYQKNRGSIQRVIAAYNAGPGMVDKYRGVPPFRETRTYVTRVLGFMKQFTPPKGAVRPAMILPATE